MVLDVNRRAVVLYAAALRRSMPSAANVKTQRTPVKLNLVQDNLGMVVKGIRVARVRGYGEIRIVPLVRDMAVRELEIRVARVRDLEEMCIVQTRELVGIRAVLVRRLAVKVLLTRVAKTRVFRRLLLCVVPQGNQGKVTAGLADPNRQPRETAPRGADCQHLTKVRHSTLRPFVFQPDSNDASSPDFFRKKYST